jgi:hypothetical protein
MEGALEEPEVAGGKLSPFGSLASSEAHVLWAWSPAWHDWEVVEPLRGGA